LFRPADHVGLLPATQPKLIVIDPGHGGVDPGTQNLKLGVNEKTCALDVALRLAKLLELRGWRTLLVRDKDTELSKDKRADLLMRNELANRNKADLYLSIHFNSAGPAVAGIETYSLAPQYMLSAGDELGDDMTKVAYPGNRLDYANLLLGAQLHRAMIAGLRTPDRGLKHARKAVLRMLDCPGALVECGYLSNEAEARRIATPEFRQQIAESLAAGLQGYAAALAALRPAAVPDAAKTR
jgi:N-acetylmuramoyl-L-alanine amidase